MKKLRKIVIFEGDLNIEKAALLYNDYSCKEITADRIESYILKLSKNENKDVQELKENKSLVYFNAKDYEDVIQVFNEGNEYNLDKLFCRLSMMLGIAYTGVIDLASYIYNLNKENYPLSGFASLCIGDAIWLMNIIIICYTISKTRNFEEKYRVKKAKKWNKSVSFALVLMCSGLLWSCNTIVKTNEHETKAEQEKEFITEQDAEEKIPEEMKLRKINIENATRHE